MSKYAEQEDFEKYMNKKDTDKISLELMHKKLTYLISLLESLLNIQP